jgi:hypothetical protein
VVGKGSGQRELAKWNPVLWDPVGGRGGVHALPIQARVHHVPVVDITGHRTISQRQSQWWAVLGPWGQKETDCNVAS